MNHNIDTKAILELAEMGDEVKAYLEEQYPLIFIYKKLEEFGFEDIFGYDTSQYKKYLLINEGISFVFKSKPYKDSKLFTCFINPVVKFESDRVIRIDIQLSYDFLLNTDLKVVLDYLAQLFKHNKQCRKLK